MSFSLYATTFVDFVSRVPAGFLNKIRTEMSQAVDGAAGGDYTPTAKLRFGGTAGVEWYGTGNGAWPLVSSRTVTHEHQLLKPTQFSASADVDLASSDLSAVVGGTAYFAPNIITTATAANNHWHMMEIVTPIDASVLASVAIETKYVAADSTGMTNATYDVFRWKVGTGGLTIASLRSGGKVSDDHTMGGAGNHTTIRTQTITLDQNNTIDLSQWRYGIRVEHPYGAGSGDGQIRIYSMRGNYTVTSLRPG